jgi:hypothetical protein
MTSAPRIVREEINSNPNLPQVLMHAGWLQFESRVVVGVMLVALLAACHSSRVPTERVPIGVGSCVDASTSCGSTTAAASIERGLAIATRYRVRAITTRRFTHDEFWRAVAPSLADSALRTEEIGQSILGRSIRAVTFGHGPTSVLLWSQMHGDESTATMALADIFRYLAEARGDSLRQRLLSGLTVTFVPMLNPDGAELFQRQNAVGIDVNRDARRLSTPEARALRALRDRLEPDFGFNLHDQNARTRVGRAGEQAAIALLAPASGPDRGWTPGRTRARLLASTIAQQLQEEIPGRVAKYDDTFNPRAFGDLIQQSGTSTVLIESGALPDDPQKQRLRAINVAAILGALDAIATGGYSATGSAAYDDLPFNQGGASDVIVLGARIVLPGRSPVLADVALNYDDAVARTGPRVREIGDLEGAVAIDTVHADGQFLHFHPGSLVERGTGRWIDLDALAVFDIRRGPEPSSELVRSFGRGR